MAGATRNNGSESTRGKGSAGAAVPAAARTLSLFEIFAREKRPLAKSELARLLDLPESSCSDLLNTIHALGYVSRTASTRRFYPTSRLLMTATSIAEHDPLGAVAVEATSMLSQLTGETSTFGVIDGDAAKILSVMQGAHRLRYVVHPGDRVTLHATAVGKALLGQLPAEELARLMRLKPLRKLTEKTITDPKQIIRQIEGQRGLGWYGAVNEGTDGVASLAISGLIGSEVAAMSIIGPTARISDNKDRYLELLAQVGASVF